MSNYHPTQRDRADQYNSARRHRVVAQYLMARLPEPDASLYIKAREIAADLDCSAHEVGDVLATLDECQQPVHAVKWTTSTPTTWRVVRE
jgi:hypothetical protein